MRITPAALDLEIGSFRTLAEEKRASIHDKDIYAALLELRELRASNDSRQARIDELMMEFCPDEMTPEQMRVWGESQRPSPTHESRPAGGYP